MTASFASIVELGCVYMYAHMFICRCLGLYYAHIIDVAA